MKDVPQLKYVREGRALSQRDLAAISGVAHDTIGQLERGERQARPSTIRKLAEALGVEPSVLIAESQRDAWTQMDTARAGQGRYERFEEVQARRVRASMEDRRRRSQQAWEKQRSRETEWEAAGKWAEYYVSGEAARVDDLPAEDREPMSKEEEEQLGSFREREYLRRKLLLHKGTQREELTIAWLRIDSDDPKETVGEAQLIPQIIREALEDLRKKQASFEAIPEHYYKHPTCRRRIEQLRQDLGSYREEIVEAVQELLELHAEALHRLDGTIDEMRKEGDELAVFVHRAGI